MSTPRSAAAFALAPHPVSETEKQHYRDEGYVVLRNVLTREQAGLLRGEVMDIMQKIGLEPTKLKQSWQYLSGSSLDHFVHSEVITAPTGKRDGH